MAGCSAAAWVNHDKRMETMTDDFKAKCCDLDRTDQQCTKNKSGGRLTAFMCTRCGTYVQRNLVWFRPCKAACSRRPSGAKKADAPSDLPTLWEWRAAAKGLSGHAAKDHVEQQKAPILRRMRKRRLDSTDAEKAEQARKDKIRHAKRAAARAAAAAGC